MFSWESVPPPPTQKNPKTNQHFILLAAACYAIYLVELNLAIFRALFKRAG